MSEPKTTRDVLPEVNRIFDLINETLTAERVNVSVAAAALMMSCSVAAVQIYETDEHIMAEFKKCLNSLRGIQ